MHADVGKESTSEQGEKRRLVNPRLRYQKESYSWSQTWTSMRRYMYHKAHEMLKKARKHNWTDGTTMTNTASLWQILGGTDEQIIEYDEIALEDHS